MELSEKLKWEREKKKFSQAYVAEQLHLTRQAISKWENGHTYPDIDNLKLLSKLYGISLDELLDSDEDMAEISEEKEGESEAMENKMSGEKKHYYMLLLSMLVLVSCVIPPLAVIMGIIVIVINKRTGLSWIPLYILCIVVIIINIYSSYALLNSVMGFWGKGSVTKI